MVAVPGTKDVQVTTPLDTLVMSRDRAGMMLYEWGTWARYYAPRPFDFRGKTILDVGAGEGETVELYRQRGAARFICVEPDAIRAGKLRANSERNKWDAEIFEEPFSRKFLQMRFDFMKMDCEGCESLLIGTDVAFPAVLETHGDTTADFLKMKGFSALKTAGNSALLSNVANF